METASGRDQGTRTAAILVIGNEVLSGKVVDSNSPWLLKELYGLGVKTRRVLTIPDELEIIAQEVRALSAQVDYVFTSGGIGPTHDDVTILGVARAFGVELVQHPDLLAMAQQHYQKRLTQAVLRMTYVPDGASLVWGSGLNFPITRMHNVHIFPGVPEYFRAKFEAIREQFRDTPYHLVRIYTRQGESVLAALLEQTLEQHPGVEIGSYPRFDTEAYRVMVTLESKEEAALLRARDTLVSLLAPEQLVEVVSG